MSSIAPGPGAYDQDVSMIKSHNPAFKIGTELRSTKNLLEKIQPGPGQYYRE